MTCVCSIYCTIIILIFNKQFNFNFKIKSVKIIIVHTCHCPDIQNLHVNHHHLEQ